MYGSYETNTIKQLSFNKKQFFLKGKKKKDITMVMTKYYEQFYANNFDDLKSVS